MIQITITPGLWIIIIVLASILDFFFGNLKFFLIPDLLITKFSGLLVKIFNRGENKHLKGLIAWFIFSTTILFIIVVFNYLSYRVSPVFFIVLNVILLTAVLGERRLFLNSRRYTKLLRANEYEELESILKDDYVLSLNSKYNLIRASIEECTEDGIKLIIGPIFFMFVGVITSIFVKAVNPVVLTYIYFYSKIFASQNNLHLDTEFYYYISNIFRLLNSIPCFLGALLYIYSGSLQGFNYQKAMEVFHRNRKKEKIDSYGLPIASIAGILGIQLSLTNVRSDGSIIQRIVGDPIYQPEIFDIRETMDTILFSEVILLVSASLIVTCAYLIYTLIYL